MKYEKGNVMYRVYGESDGEPFDVYFRATTAQMAADIAREVYGEGCSVIEVAKVVRNWR